MKNIDKSIKRILITGRTIWQTGFVPGCQYGRKTLLFLNGTEIENDFPNKYK